MVGYGALLSLLATTAGLLGRAGALDIPSVGDTLGGAPDSIIPNSFIVQFVDGVTDAAGVLGTVTTQVEPFLNTVQSLLDLNLDAMTITQQLNYQLFQGVVMVFGDSKSAAAGLAQLASLGNVKSITPNHLVTRGSFASVHRNSFAKANHLRRRGDDNPLAGLNPLAGATDNPLAGVVNTGLGLVQAVAGQAAGQGNSQDSQANSQDNSSNNQNDQNNNQQQQQQQQSSLPGYNGYTGCEYNATYAPLFTTQVNKLHERGIFGNGTKVCVIDSGVDYNHPALSNSAGPGFGPGHLVSFGKDLVGDNHDPSDPNSVPVPDDDPLDPCDGHGTMVSGIIAAQPGNEYGLVGVAPGVTIGAFRAIGCDGRLSTAMMIQSLNEAYEGGCEIISVSWGVYSASSQDPVAQTAQKIVEAGVPCVIAPGNAGADGLFHNAAPASGRGVAAVGSIDNDFIPDLNLVGNFTIDGGEPQMFKWRPNTPKAWAGVELPLWTPNLTIHDTSDREGACPPIFPPDTPDLSGHIALVHATDCYADDIAAVAVSHGAKYVIFIEGRQYNLENGTIGTPGVLANAVVSDLQGFAWIRALAAGSTVTVQMADPDTLTPELTWAPNNVTAGLVSSYTSIGLTNQLDVKPQFTAPGGHYLLATLVANGSYDVYSGTSFSAPFAAGVFALIAEARGSLDPELITNLLSATAQPQVFFNELKTFPYLATVAQQGAGTIRAFDAAFATTLLSTSSIALNDTDNFEPNHNFSIKNLGNEAVTFNLGHSGAATTYTFAAAGGTEAHTQLLQNVEVTDEYATIEFDGGSQVTVPAGGEMTVSLTVTPPLTSDPKRIPVYSGWITLNGTNGENLSLPYAGVVGSMRGIQMIADAYLTNSTDPNVARINETVSFLVPYNEYSFNNSISYPLAYVDLAFNAAVLDVRLLSWNGTKNGTQDIDPGTDLGSILYCPDHNVQANNPGLFGNGAWANTFDGNMADGSLAPEGTYIFEFSVLKNFGDQTKDVDYEYRRSVPFSLQYSHE